MDRKVFINGGSLDQTSIQYLAKQTGKKRPKICYIPTANGDKLERIKHWYELCSKLEVEPSVMEVWINSYSSKKSWEDILLNVDGVFVGGGNTLNMIAIWKAQGIDKALRKAYEKGVVMSGGSAGSLCWFEGGTTDSRPKEVTIVECMGWLQYSHCPHYHSEESRRPLYHENIRTGKLSSGYALDEGSGVLFVNEKMNEAFSFKEGHHAYFVHAKNGEVIEKQLSQ